MMYSYIKFSDETEISFSQIIKKDNKDTIQVHFKRPKEYAFDTARCELPSYNWIKKEGYSKEEIDMFTKFLEYNAHLLFKYSREGGIKIA